MCAARSREPGRPEGHTDESDVRKALEQAYGDLLREQLAAWAIPPGMVGINIHRLGRAGDGLPIFIAMLRISRWIRVPGFRLLVGLPMLEASVSKAVSSSWLAELSHFGGVWLHASSTLHKEIPASELNGVLEGIARSAARDEPDGRSYWASLDAESGEPVVRTPAD